MRWRVHALEDAVVVAPIWTVLALPLLVLHDAALAARVRAQVDALPWPDEQRVKNRIKLGRAQKFFSSPLVFTLTGFPILWAFSWFDASPEVYLWEKIRSLHPLPDSYTERFPNLQAAIDRAPANSFVRVGRGTWSGDVRVIDKSVTVFADPGAVVLGSGAGAVGAGCSGAATGAGLAAFAAIRLSRMKFALPTDTQAPSEPPAPCRR